MSTKFLNSFAKQFAETLPPSFQKVQGEFEKYFLQGLQNLFARLDFVTREEFDIQAQQLERLQVKVTNLEEKLSLLEPTLLNRGER